jgi:hypothetical protein
MGLESTATCDFPQCQAQRREVNNWYVVAEDRYGVRIYHWDKCPTQYMKGGKHFCGLDHAFRHASSVMTPDHTDANRESTYELKPPLTREGTVPIESVVAEVNEALSDRID